MYDHGKRQEKKVKSFGNIKKDWKKQMNKIWTLNTKTSPNHPSNFFMLYLKKYKNWNSRHDPKRFHHKKCFCPEGFAQSVHVCFDLRNYVRIFLSRRVYSIHSDRTCLEWFTQSVYDLLCPEGLTQSLKKTSAVKNININQFN